MSTDYEALDIDTLAQRLGGLPALKDRLGPAESWKIREVGDGNLNLVFIVESEKDSVVVKQALPYVRLVGDSWPLPLTRAFFEYHALTRQEKRDPGAVPTVLHFDETQALIVMEYLSPHLILRQKLIQGEKVENLGGYLGLFCARTAFRGSDLSMKAADKKADTALFLGNVELCAITENLVFTDPYFSAEMNRHTPELDPVVVKLRGDDALKTKAQAMLMRFTSGAETLVHGDLHTGSVMCTDKETKVIDPEFACYGPLGFDLGMLIANFLMAYFSQPAHRSDNLDAYQSWILSVIEDTATAFSTEFTQLWATERNGILFPHSLWEDQGQSSDNALKHMLETIWTDAMGFAGIEMHRRCLSLAHNADFEVIEDTKLRAQLEARNLMMGREIVLTPPESVETLLSVARRFNAEEIL